MKAYILTCTDPKLPVEERTVVMGLFNTMIKARKHATSIYADLEFSRCLDFNGMRWYAFFKFDSRNILYNIHEVTL